MNKQVALNSDMKAKPNSSVGTIIDDVQSGVVSSNPTWVSYFLTLLPSFGSYS